MKTELITGVAIRDMIRDLSRQTELQRAIEEDETDFSFLDSFEDCLAELETV